MASIFRCSIMFSLFVLTALGQDTLLTTPLTLEQVKNSYENVRYAQVVTLVKSELEARPQQPLPRLEMLLKYLALAQASLGKEDEARSTMASLVLVNPNFKFQPDEVSPKILELYHDVRSEFVRSPDLASHSPSYLIKTDRRAELMLKSVTFPGWGQIEAGKKRGYFWGIGFSAVLVGSGVASYMAAQTHDDYLAAYDPAVIQSRYTTYNNWYQWRNTLLSLTVLTYTVNLLDISFLTQ